MDGQSTREIGGINITKWNVEVFGVLKGSKKMLDLTETVHLVVQTGVFHPEVNNGHVLVKA